MNYSQYFLYVPYCLTWYVYRFCRTVFRKDMKIIFYCGTAIDYAVFKNVHRFLPEVEVIAKNTKVRKELKKIFKIESSLYPSFPDVLIMNRHTARKFPGKKMLKFGLRHGAYHFKDFVSPKRYNAFDVYFVTSETEARLARERGIRSAVPGGFPKIDDAFNGRITKEQLTELKNKLGFDNNKPTVIFTATWENSRMSRVDKWAERLDEITNDYNILASLHPWVSEKYYTILRNNPQISFIETRDVLPYLMISDVMVADMSSIIAEFCALDKPLITFKIFEGKRISQEVVSMLEQISFRVESFEDIIEALDKAVHYPHKHSAQRQKFNKIMFDKLDGKAGEKIATLIRDEITKRGI